MGPMEQQLQNVMTTPGNNVRIRIWGDAGGTEPMEISPETFDAIERLLIEKEN